MGQILKGLIAQPRFIDSTVGSTPVRIAYRVAPGQDATRTDPAYADKVLLLYVVLGLHILALDLFSPLDIAAWQDQANEEAAAWADDEVLERADYERRIQRDVRLCDMHAGVEL